MRTKRSGRIRNSRKVRYTHSLVMEVVSRQVRHSVREENIPFKVSIVSSLSPVLFYLPSTPASKFLGTHLHSGSKPESVLATFLSFSLLSFLLKMAENNFFTFFFTSSNFSSHLLFPFLQSYHHHHLMLLCYLSHSHSLPLIIILQLFPPSSSPSSPPPLFGTSNFFALSNLLNSFSFSNIIQSFF